MSTNSQSDYFIDTESAAEMARLIQQDMMITRKMGGPLAEQADPSSFSTVLDLGCGPGGWVLDVAFACPDAEVAGIDISKTMTSYGNARASSQGLHNASFEVMDITKPLAFSDQTFDLVNGRLLVGSLHRTAWSQMIQECFRITRPGGVMRMTELDTSGVTTSPAYNYLDTLLVKATWLTGLGFSRDGRTTCMTPMLPTLLRNAGYQDIQHRPHAFDFSAGTDIHMDFYRDYEVFFKLALPFLVSVGVATQEEVDRAYQQMLIEMLSDDFKGMWYLLTVWGKKPE
ncbi:MAG TPA: class I SAM-dependent methyltransferase [Ktedonobacteraceae bacterium]|nr:class I SAM-dependent methyltransferase [Ktedonobacteraceae bacterium]